MKNTFFYLLAFFIVFSCGDDDSSDNPMTTVEEDQQNIEASITSFYSCLQAFEDGDFSEFLIDAFIDIDGEIDTNYIDFLFEEFEEQHGSLFINDRFQFSNRLGTYTWNEQTSIWDIEANSNEIILNFPSTLNLGSNDMELGITSYSDLLVSYSSDEYWLPTAASAYVNQNGNSLITISASDITFDVDDNFSMPTNADISIFTAPFTHTINVSRLSPTDFEFEYGFQNGANCITQLFLLGQLENSDYGNITSVEEDVQSVNGSILHNNFKVEFSAQVSAISAIEEPTVTDINTFLDAEVFFNDMKIGDLIYDEIDDEVQIFIVFSDGSQQNADVYVGDFLDEIEFIFAEYIN